MQREAPEGALFAMSLERGMAFCFLLSVFGNDGKEKKDGKEKGNH